MPNNQNNQKKYASLSTLQTFLDNLKTTFSAFGHKHTTADITDYAVDSELSSTSTNPVQNKVLNAEFDEIAVSMRALETALDAKSDSTHDHNSLYYTESEIDQKLSAVNTSIDNIKSGEIVVKEAEHAGSADSATTANSANHATTADSATSATKATQDASGNVITSTYETKTDATAKLNEAKSYTDTKTANLASTSSVDTKITTHNTSTTAHSDIRDLISGLTTRLNTLANSDDTTLDQLSEIVAYIKNNKSLIDGITTSKVNVADIVNNLTTNVTNKPLSAAQGVAIKSLIDVLQEELDSHTHAISDVSGLQSALDSKAASSHGTHVTYSTTAPVMDGTASVGSASTVARSDHKHPTDTSRASQADLDALENVVAGKANATHNHAISDITNLQSTLDELQEDIDSIPQSDWNQHDSTKLDYIKNRTHWSKTESTVVSEETVDTSDYTYYFTTPFALNVGQTYIVVFDGTTYNCVAFRDNSNYNRATIGGSYSNYETYPFSIYVKSNGDTCITTEVNSTHTVKVTNVNETIQKLDEKYIPDTFAKVDYVEDTIANVEDSLLDKIDTKANTSDITSGFVLNVVTTLDTSSWKGVVYGDGKYVAVNYENFAYSTDGINWTYGTLPISASGIAYGNGMYCAYGYSDTNVCYSTDGINWNTASTNYNSNKFSIYFLNDKFFISAGYAILSSSNCTSWSKFELGESCTLYGGAYGNGVYIMSGYGDTFISTNGTSWTKTTALSTTENYGSIFFVDGKFIAIAHGTTNYGASNKIAYSTNGTSWTYGTLPITAKWVEGSYCNGTFMIAGYQSLAYSSDGVNWEVGSLPEGWNTIETMGSGNEFLFFQGSGNEVAIAKKNPYDLVFKPDTNWVQIYDSGEITEKVNAFANINISGYKKLMVVVKCVNDGTNSPSKHGGVTFTSTNGVNYQFNLWSTMFTNAAYTSGAMATFEISDGWLICPNATRILKSSNFLGTEGGVADNLNNTGSGIMRCTNTLSTMMVHNTDNDSNYYFLAGSRVMVWGCNA